MVRQFLLMFALLLTAVHGAAQVTATVNRTELYDDESLLLTVSVSPIGELNQRDLDALASLFTIEQSFRQESRQSINGKTTTKVDFQFRLTPKQSGTLGIPNFRVNGEQSQPMFITVLESTKRVDDLAEDAVIFTATLSSQEPYIDQPITLTLELDYKIQFRDAKIADVPMDDFDTALLAENQTTKTLNGQTYNVYLRTYQLTPKKPGLYRLPDFRFTAEYPNQKQGRFIRFTRKAETPALTVRDIPADFPAGAYWLPLSDLTLTDNLSTRIESEQNEHIDWQVTMTAQGLPANRLPDVLKGLENSLPDDVKLYRNAPKITETQRLDSAALSFLQPGTKTLPSLRVPWWNTRTDSLEWATLPGKTFVINANPQAQSSLPEPAPLIQPTPVQEDAQVAPLPKQPAEFNVWQWLTIGSMLGWLLSSVIFIVMWRRWQRQLNAKEDSVNPPAKRHAEPVTAGQCYQAYLRLLRTQRLDDDALTARLADDEIKLLQQLESSLFYNQSATPDITAIQKILKKLEKPRPTQVAQGRFNLYPSSESI